MRESNSEALGRGLARSETRHIEEDPEDEGEFLSYNFGGDEVDEHIGRSEECAAFSFLPYPERYAASLRYLEQTVCSVRLHSRV